MIKCMKGVLGCDKEAKITYKGIDYCWDHFDEVTKPKETPKPVFTDEEMERMADEFMQNGGVICYDGI